MFLATSGNRNESNLLNITEKLDIIESKFHSIFIGKHCFNVFSGILKIYIVSVSYYCLPFHSNIETQVLCLVFPTYYLI